VQSLIARSVQVYGRLDCAHNNAGISRGRAVTAEYAEEQWDQVIAINLTGVWLCLKYELQQMIKQGGGAIVNTASIAGLVGIVGNAGYVASKHGVVGLTRAAALENAPLGIRVNAVCPGYIDTPLLSALTADEANKATIISRHPLGRLGMPSEVAEAVVWLCSDAASFVTGHTLTIDGGYVAQ
jgi:NAD(P)-dependent dehydrogenase (short-subunit alcohol dehydrogenase family)